MSVPVQSPIFGFGEYEFNGASMELTKRGIGIRLQRQPARLLELLLTRAGDIVTRNEIRDLLWSDGTTVDFEIGMNRCVRQLRAALLDDIGAPRYIKTIPRVGYSFIAPLAKREAAALDTSPSIVVLPFSNLTNAVEDEYFCDGLTEEIINALAQIPDLKVIARTSAFMFKGKHEDVRKIAETLNVSNVFEGSVRRSGSRIRVTAQLIRAADGTHVFSKRYDHEISDVFAMQDEIAADIAEQLRSRLALRKTPVTDLAAYRAYLEGRFNWHKLTSAGLAKSFECYQKAISLDPDYAPALSGTAQYYVGLAMFIMASAAEVLPKAQAAAQRALAVDRDSAEAHTVLGCVESMNYDWSASERHFECAREISFDSLRWLAHAVWHLLPLGKIDDAVAECEKVIEHDPLHLLARVATASVLYGGRRYKAAEEQCRRALNIDAAFPLALHWLVDIAIAEGRNADALNHSQKLALLHGESMIALGSLAIAHAANGDRENVLAISKKIESRPNGPQIGAGFIAQAHALLGETDTAFDWLELAVKYHVPRICWIKSLPWMDPLCSHPRYERLLRSMNL